jgi:hypothetical protein
MIDGMGGSEDLRMGGWEDRERLRIQKVDSTAVNKLDRVKFAHLTFVIVKGNSNSVGE